MHPSFKKNGYLVVRNFFDNSTVTLLQSYFDFKVRGINIKEARSNLDYRTIKTGDVADSFVYYGDHLIESLSLIHGQRMCNILNLSLSPTYTLARIYEKGSKLIPHLDRDACEISATCPVFTSDSSSSTIYISNVRINDTNRIMYTEEDICKKGDFNKIDMLPGDVLFYKGREHYHWREELKTDYLVQFFMHFVLTDGQYKEWVNDKRAHIS